MNFTTIQYLFDDHTTFHKISLIKILDKQLRFSCDDIRWWSPHWYHILNLEISKKKFHPSIQHNGGGIKWEWKIQKISPQKLFCTQTRFSKVIILWLTNHTCHLSWKWRLLWEVPFLISSRLWDIKKNFTPATCPIWGHVFGSKKSKKSDPQSGFRPKHDFEK